jgi:glycosyltransferase involved in cell wall biosynthesis
MKISMIGPVYPYRGGIAHYTTSLAVALKNAGHEVKVHSFKRQYPAFLYPGETDKDPSANPVRVESEYTLDPIYPWTWWKTARKIFADEPDLVLIQWWTTFWAPAYAALAFHLSRRKIPIIYLIHNVLPHENRVWDRLLARFALGQASAFIVQTSSEQKKLLDLIPSAKINYCSHPMYQRFSELVVSKEMARQQVGLPVDKPIFLFFGIVRPYKGLKHLIDAIARLVDSSVHLAVAGEFWEDVELYQKQVDGLGLTGRVTLFNKYLPNEEAHLFFSSADALVAPYVGGTQSGVVELALGYGLPVILTDRIADGISASDTLGLWIVPAGNAEALASAIDKLVKNPLKLSPSKDANNDWERMVQAVEEVRFSLS